MWQIFSHRLRIVTHFLLFCGISYEFHTIAIYASFFAIILIILWIFYPAINIYWCDKEDDSYLDSLIIDNIGNVDSKTTIKENPSVHFSIVIPAYNEEKRLPSMLEETTEFMKKWSENTHFRYEILVVDDGSKDKTVETVIAYMSLDPENIRLLKLGVNQGKGGAVSRGVSRARGRYILMADADGATDIKDFKVLYDAMKSVEIKSGAYQSYIGAVYGSRAHLEKKSIASRSLLRTILMYGFHLLVKALCTKHVRDTQCGFKLFTRKTAEIIFPLLHLRRWSFDIELVYLIEKFRFPFTEVAVNWHEVEGSKLIQNKLDIILVSLNMARDMLCVKLCYLLQIWSYESAKQSWSIEKYIKFKDM